MQDFGRANATFQHKSRSSGLITLGTPESMPVELNYERKCCNVDISLENNKIGIVYCYEQRGDYLRKKFEFISAEEQNLFNRDDGFLDYSALGINKITLDAKVG